MFRVLFRLLSKKLENKSKLENFSSAVELAAFSFSSSSFGSSSKAAVTALTICSHIHALSFMLFIFFWWSSHKDWNAFPLMWVWIPAGFKTWSALSVFCGRLLLHSFLVLFAHGLLQSLICRLWLSFPCPKCFSQRTILDTEIHQGTWLSNTINQNPTRKLNMGLSRTKSTQHHVPVLFAELCQSQFGCHRTALTSYWT